MAQIKSSDIINGSEINAEVQKVIKSLNDLMKQLGSLSVQYQKTNGSTKELNDLQKKNSEAAKLEAKAAKETEAAQKSLQAQRQKALAEMAKMEAKQRELVNSANKEVKSLGDLNEKLSAQRKLIQTMDFNSKEYDEMASSIEKLAIEQDLENSKLQIFNQRVGNYQKAVNSVNMSLGEMKLELRELRNMSFANLKPEEITQIRDRMAELTEAVGDFQSQIKTASADRIPALMDGLQGLVAVAQGVTGTLAIFGVETEKLNKTMVQLIGVSQALKTIQELQEKGTLKVAWATAKDTASKITNAIAAKGQTLATTGTTAATRTLGKAMSSNPYLIIAAAIAAVVAALILLSKSFSGVEKAQKAINEAISNSTSEYIKERTEMINLVKVSNDHSKSLEDRKAAIEELNKISPEYLGWITLETVNTDAARLSLAKYNEEINKKAKLRALENLLSEKYSEAEKARFEKREKDLKDANVAIAEIEKRIDDLTKPLFERVGEQSSLIGTTIFGVPEGTESLDIDGTPIIFKNGKWESKKINKNTKTETENPYEEYLKTIKNINDEFTKMSQFAKTQTQLDELKASRDQKIFDTNLNYYGKVTEEMQNMIDAYSVSIDYVEKLEKSQAKLNIANDYDIELIKKAKEETLSYHAARLKIISDFDFLATKPLSAFEKLQKAAKDFGEFWGKYGEAIETTLNGIAQGIDGIYDNQIDKQQTAADNNAKYYDNLLDNYEQDSAEYNQLLQLKEDAQENYQKKIVDLERKKAVYDKIKSLFDIAISTAKGIMAALGSIPPNPILAAAIGVTGGIQAGIVASQQLPQYKFGLDSAKEDHIGIVADGDGPEIVNYPDGSSAVFTKPTATFIPKFTSIDTASETKAKLKSLEFQNNMYKFTANNEKQTAYLATIARNTASKTMSDKDLYFIQRYAK